MVRRHAHGIKDAICFDFTFSAGLQNGRIAGAVMTTMEFPAQLLSRSPRLNLSYRKKP